MSARAQQLLKAAAAEGPEYDDEITLGLAVPAALRLLDDEVTYDPLGPLQQLVASGPRLGTFTGQSRTVYHPLAVHLQLRALAVADEPLTEHLRQAVRNAVGGYAPAQLSLAQPALRLWQALVLYETAALLGEQPPASAQQVVEQMSGPTPRGEVHRQSADDALDEWTYQELAALHAMANLAVHTGDAQVWRRVEAAAEFHLGHTQPDYTTYEPWGIFAFVRQPLTIVFADQQLHDLQTNVQLSGPRSGLVPGLLLADAAHAMSREQS